MYIAADSLSHFPMMQSSGCTTYSEDSLLTRSSDDSHEGEDGMANLPESDTSNHLTFQPVLVKTSGGFLVTAVIPQSLGSYC